MESADSGDAFQMSFEYEKDIKTDEEENDVGYQRNNTLRAKSEGFVILCPNKNVNEGMKDETTVPAWVQSRLTLMKIKPIVITLEELRKRRKPKKQRKLGSILNVIRSKSTHSSDESEVDMLVEYPREGCTLWKFVAIQDMKTRHLDDLEAQRQSKPSENDSDSEDYCRIKKSTKFRNLSSIMTTEPYEPPPENRNQLLRMYKGLTEMFKSISSKSKDHIWVALITNTFNHPKEVDILEEMSNKFEFTVLSISGPDKANIFRTLVTVAERREQILWEKGLLDPNKDPLLFHQQYSYNQISNIDADLSVQTGEFSRKDTDQKEMTSSIMESPEFQNLSDESEMENNDGQTEQLREQLSYEDGNERLNYEDSQSSEHSDDSSIFEMSEDNLFLCLNQVTKIVMPDSVLPILFQDCQEGESADKIALVVMVTDLGTDKNNNYSLARAMKEKLRRSKINCYIITVSNLMKDLQAIQVMKNYASNIAATNNSTDGIDGYLRLILAVVAEKMNNKKRRVIIVDLGDESLVQLKPIKDFCIRSYAEVFTIERSSEELIDAKLATMCSEIRKRFENFNWNFTVPLSQERQLRSLEIETSSNDLTLSQHEYLEFENKALITEINPEDELTDSKSNLDSSPRPKDVNVTTIEALEQVRSKLTSKSDSEATCSVSNSNNNDNDGKRTGVKKRMRKHYRSGSNMKKYAHLDDDESSRSSQEQRLKIISTGSEDSIILNRKLGQKPKLIKYHRMPEKLSSLQDPNSNEVIQSQDDDCLYKGWVADVAVPEHNTDVPSTQREKISILRKLMKNTGHVIILIFRSIGSLFTCKPCREPNPSRVAPVHNNYRAINFNDINYDEAH